MRRDYITQPICMNLSSGLDEIPVTVANGGTGVTELSVGEIVLGNGTNPLTTTAILPITKGGTGATTALDALINLGVSDANETDFEANDYASWLSQVQAYVDENLQTRRTFVFNAGWQGVGYGSGLAYQTLDRGFKFLILYNSFTEAGVKFYYKEPNENWSESPTNRGTTLYYNASGSSTGITTMVNGVVTSVRNFQYIEILYQNNDAEYSMVRLINPDIREDGVSGGKRFSMLSAHNYYKNDSPAVSLKSSNWYVSGAYIGPASEISGITTCEVKSNGTSVETVSQPNNIKIVKVIGYK